MNLICNLWWEITHIRVSGILSQITSLMIVYSTVYSDADQRKHQSSRSLAIVRGIHREPVNSLHKRPVTRKCFHLMTSSCFTKSHSNPTVNSNTFVCVSVLWEKKQIIWFPAIFQFWKTKQETYWKIQMNFKEKKIPCYNFWSKLSPVHHLFVSKYFC